jgi:arylsulfatase A-like enzyme
MTRHFVWLTPLVNLFAFLCVGLCLAGLAKVAPRLTTRLGPVLLCALALLPMLILVGPQIYPEARLLLALGMASWLAPWLVASHPARLRGGLVRPSSFILHPFVHPSSFILHPFESHPARLRRSLVRSFPALLGLVVVMAAFPFGGDWLKRRREAGRPLPPASSPSVLLVVLDTVRADRLSLYGYHRSTTPTLERLARRGIRFDAARASAPWTLMSHASFFSGRWPHELDIQWQTPLTKKFPMLAEYLAENGYATAGLVSNATYCSYDTGLDRGFTHYEDYVLDELNILRTAVIVGEIRKTLLFLVFLGLRHDPALLQTAQDILGERSDNLVRRDAESINRGVLSWLDHRRDSSRPFFLFLNYLDAHAPYKLPTGATHRFGKGPRTREEIRIIYEDWSLIDKSLLAKPYKTLALDGYDNCLAYLDERLGQLFDDLASRRVLDQTWVVIMGDHGEGLGEHDLYEHGESLYSTEIHVPLLIVPPAGESRARVVRDVVSLRDIPATVVDLLGLGAGSPFPGRSLATLWRGPSPGVDPAQGADVLSELPSPSPRDSSHGRSPALRGPLVSLADRDLVYIQNEADGTEELYNERDDPWELTNRAASDTMRPVVQRFRERLARLKPGPKRAGGRP